MEVKAAQQPGDDLWHPSWEPAAGEATIRARSAPQDVKLFCSWFCPFAQRAWIALEEKGAPYEYVEINPYEVDAREPGGYTKKQLPLEEKARRNGTAFLAASPRGLVPAIQAGGGRRVWESLPLVEFAHEGLPGAPLLPDDPYQRAVVRIWSEHSTSRMQRAFYTLMMEQNPSAERRAELEDNFFRETTALAEAMAPLSNGPFFLGKHFSMVDIALAPFWQRFLWVGTHYLGLTFPETPAFSRMASWWEACLARPSVAATIVCRPRLISSYSQYVRGLGTSDCAKNIMGDKATGGKEASGMQYILNACQRVHSTCALVALSAFVSGAALGAWRRT